MVSQLRQNKSPAVIETLKNYRFCPLKAAEIANVFGREMFDIAADNRGDMQVHVTSRLTLS